MILRRIVAVTTDQQVQQLARRVSQEIFVADDPAEALDITLTVRPELILFDHRFGPAQIREFIHTTDKNSINVPVIAIADNQNLQNSPADFMRTGALDCLRTKQDYQRLEQIATCVKNTAEEKNSQRNSTDFFAEDYAASIPIVGQSKAIRNKLKMIRLIAASQCNPVLIVGETGTGKELAAKAIHALRHPNEQFIAVNCAALTANLLESELFGHVKGAFTGADKEKTGLLQLAGSGTIFLDEISEMPLDLQPKLLRVLQEKTFRKVGGLKTIHCNATIITSSNLNLKKATHANRFRRDLYYRLSLCPINIAPLRSPDRIDDIPLLAQFFLRTSNICPEKKGRINSLTKLTVEALKKYHWPGNVRELSNIIERAILLETTDKIGLTSIIFDPPEYDQAPNTPTFDQIKDFSLEKAERELIARALQKTGWQKTQAAALLGITRATLYAKVKQYNIEKDSSLNHDRKTQKNALQEPPVQAPDEISTLNLPEPLTVA